MSLKAYATRTLPAVTTAAHDAADANERLSKTFSPGFLKLLEFKDSKGERGGTTFAAAWDLLNSQLDLMKLGAANPTNVRLQYDIASGTKRLEDYFRRVYKQLGDFQTLLKNLDRFRRAEEAAAKSKQFGSQAAPAPQQPASTTSSASLKIMHITGKLP